VETGLYSVIQSLDKKGKEKAVREINRTGETSEKMEMKSLAGVILSELIGSTAVNGFHCRVLA